MEENKSSAIHLEAVMERFCNNLTDEQKEKAKQCKNMGELMELAGKEGMELPDEALDAVAGGCGETGQDSGTRFSPL